MTTLPSPALDDQLQGYLDHLTIERGVAANTLSSYRRDLRRYAEHLTLRGIDDLGKVTETDVSDFLAALRRGDADTGAAPLSAVSAARALIAVRGLHRFAAAEGAHRTRRGPRRQAADAEQAAAQEPDHRRGAGPAGGRGRRQRGRRSADAAQPGTARAAVFHRRADLRGGRARHRRHRHPRPFGAVAGQGRQAAAGADRSSRRHRAGRLPGARAARTWPGAARARPRSSSTPAVDGCRGKARGRCCRTPPNGQASPPRCLRTPCGTPSPPTCSTAAPTSAWCRSCSATRR